MFYDGFSSLLGGTVFGKFVPQVGLWLLNVPRHAYIHFGHIVLRLRGARWMYY